MGLGGCVEYSENLEYQTIEQILNTQQNARNQWNP